MVPGCYVRARVIGLLQMHDRGQSDDKLVAVLVADPLMDGVKSLADVSPHYRREIETFFRTYKDLEGGNTEIAGWQEADAAVPLAKAFQCRAGWPRSCRGANCSRKASISASPNPRCRRSARRSSGEAGT